MNTHPTHAQPAEEAHGISVPMPHHPINYYLIFGVLVLLTGVTLGIAIFKRFDNELINVALALSVASLKGAFVAFYFMHLKFEGKLIYFILFVPLLLTVILVCALIPDIGHGIHNLIITPGAMQEDAGFK